MYSKFQSYCLRRSLFLDSRSIDSAKMVFSHFEGQPAFRNCGSMLEFAPHVEISRWVSGRNQYTMNMSPKEGYHRLDLEVSARRVKAGMPHSTCWTDIRDGTGSISCFN